MIILGIVLVLLPPIILGLAYFGYPAVLMVVRKFRKTPSAPASSDEWPVVTIVVPVYNEAGVIASTLDRILATDYPADRRHVLVISDASSDGTDAIVERYADRGVQLVRLARRSGKTAAENEAGRHLVGEIVVNMDATVVVPPGALRHLVAAFRDPSVGVASGRDVSVGDRDQERNQGESGYVGYEMWVRRLETDCGTIVGASGCFFAIRRVLFDSIFPEALSRDFASPLIAREGGYRSVSVEDAVCYVARTRSLHAEYRRKVRTMTRGLETLWYKKRLLDPFRYGRFAFFLFAHKLLRWLVFPALVLAVVGVGILTVSTSWGWVLAALGVLGLVAGAVGYYWPSGSTAPKLLTTAAFAVSSQVAGIKAWVGALRGELNPVWEPTRRPDPVTPAGSA